MLPPKFKHVFMHPSYILIGVTEDGAVWFSSVDVYQKGAEGCGPRVEVTSWQPCVVEDYESE